MAEPIHPMFALTSPAPGTRIKAGVGVVVGDGRGRVLLERRADCGLWGLPGGRLEPGESVTQAALREVREETGLTIVLRCLVGIYSEPSERIVVYLDNGDVAQLLDVIVTADIVSGEITASTESLELAFFHPADIPWDRVAPPAVAPLKDWAAGARGVIG